MKALCIGGPFLLCIEKLLDASRCRVDSRFVIIEKSTAVCKRSFGWTSYRGHDVVFHRFVCAFSPFCFLAHRESCTFVAWLKPYCRRTGLPTLQHCLSHEKCRSHRTQSSTRSSEYTRTLPNRTSTVSDIAGRDIHFQ